MTRKDPDNARKSPVHRFSIDEIEEAARTHGAVADLARDAPLPLSCGETLGPVRIAYTTHGRLNADRSNAVLICHALTGDQYVTGTHPLSGKPGWWHRMVGPGRPIDTEKYFVICPNILGSCMGTTGPASRNPETGRPFGPDFPVITIADIVEAQVLLLDHLGIDDLFCVAGGSMGGMQALHWASVYPDRVFSCAVIAATARYSAQNLAFHEVGRQAIMADPDFHEGNYMAHGTVPRAGLSVARMAAHVTYLSESGLAARFGRNLQDRDRVSFGEEADFQVESYLRHQGSTFVDRFDANSYLRLSRAMDYFDMLADNDGVLARAFLHSPARFFVMSFTSDWLFPTAESREIVHALNAAGANVSFVEVETDKGHDAFLLDVPEMDETMRGFLHGAAEHRGLTGAGKP